MSLPASSESIVHDNSKQGWAGNCSPEFRRRRARFESNKSVTFKIDEFLRFGTSVLAEQKTEKETCTS
jgi:hypothetical protein